MNWRVSVNDEIIIISSDEEDLVFVVTPMKRPASPQSDDECVPTQPVFLNHCQKVCRVERSECLIIEC